MKGILKYLRKPATIAGLAAVVGVGVAVVAHCLSWQAGVPLIVGDLAGIVLPNLPAAEKVGVEKVAAEVIADAASKGTKA